MSSISKEGQSSINKKEQLSIGQSSTNKKGQSLIVQISTSKKGQSLIGQSSRNKKGQSIVEVNKQSSQKQRISNELKQKQKYLREQILEKNFNVDRFIEYLNSKLNIQSDINRCTLKDLKKTVQNYIADVEKHQIHQSEFQNSNRLSHSRISFQSLQPTCVVKLNQQPLILQQQFKQSFKCQKINKKIFQNQRQHEQNKINFLVHSPSRKYLTTFLGVNTSSYLQFKVKTIGLDWQVKRRYSDFIWLKSTFEKFYPSQIIPPIPNKKAHKRLPRQIQKRIKILTYFLNQLLLYPEIANSIYLKGFLSYDETKFKSFRKQIDNKKSFEAISNSETLSGQIDVFLNQQIVNYNKYLAQWVEKSEVQIKTLTRSSKYLQQAIIDQVNTLYDMGDQLAELHVGASKIAKIDKRPKNGFSQLRDIFVALNNMVIQWGTVLRNQIQLIQTNCNVVFKYLRQSLAGFRQLIEKSKQHQTKYFEAKLQLDALKQKLFLSHDATRWELPKCEIAYVPKQAVYQKQAAFKIMLPKQSSVLQNFKVTYCHYLSQIYQNSNKNLKSKASLLCSAFQQFTIKQKVITQHLGSMWNEMSFNFSHAFQQDEKKKKLLVRFEQKILNQQLQKENQEQGKEAKQMTESIKSERTSQIYSETVIQKENKQFPTNKQVNYQFQFQSW